MSHIWRIHWSTVVVASFALLLGAVGFFAEVFQAPPLPQELAQLIKNPLPVEKLQRLKRMSFTNKLGSFKFENTNPEGLLDGPWQMTEPTTIKARKDFFLKVVKALGDIQVRHSHRSDTINRQSFSIDKPLFSLTLELNDGSPVEIAFGLINPIDNSTYFLVKGQEWIYQCTTLPISLESVTQEELLDSKALALNPEQVNLIELQQAPFDNQGLRLMRVEGSWQDTEGKKFDDRKVAAFLRDLQTLKSTMVLDKLTESQSTELTRLMTAPAWRLRLGQGQLPETFYVSAPLDRLGDLKLERNRSFLFYREGTQNPLVLGPEQLGIITKRERDFR
jgi:hypothetical protein